MRYDTDQPIPPSRIGFCAPVLGGGILVALVVFLIYWPARENGFVFDDWVVLDVDNVTGIRDPALWRETLFRSPADFSTLFRPLTMLTFLLQLWTDPLEPRPFHIVNLAVHSINVFLLVLVASRLPGGDVRANTRPLLAVLCGLVYGIHPALTEPVVWISARADLLMTLFLMLALLLDLMLLETGWRRAAAVGSLFLAAMLCKESAVAFLLVLPMVHLAAHWLEPRAIGRGVLANVWGQHYKVYIALLVVLVVYLAARFAVSGPTFGAPVTRHISPFSQHILVVVASLAHHIWGTLWPFQDIVPFRYLPLPINGMELLPMAAAGTAVIVVALAAVCTNSSGRVPALLFLAFVAALLPVANIVLIPAVVTWNEVAVGSRYITYPLTLACLAVPFITRLAEISLVKHVQYGRALLWVIVGVWALASIANIRVTIPLWSNDLVLNTWVVQQGRASYWHHGNIGVYYNKRAHDYVRARESLLTALKLSDDKWGAAMIWNNLGLAEFHLGRLTEAKQAFQRALELGTEDVVSRIYLANVERKTGNPQAAADILEEGLNRLPVYGRPHRLEGELLYRLGLSYSELGRYKDAVTQFNAALNLTHNPGHRRLIEQALQSVKSK